jgi:hypothetical protein
MELTLSLIWVKGEQANHQLGWQINLGDNINLSRKDLQSAGSFMSMIINANQLLALIEPP